MISRCCLLSALVAVIQLAGPGCAGVPARNTTATQANDSITRLRTGVLACRSMKTGEDCGSDRWTLTIQPDGSRTQRSFVDLVRDDSQLSLVYRADGSFRFIEAFEHAWNRGKLVGSGMYAADGSVLRVTTNGPAGYATETHDLPDRFSVLLHPVSVDGWHFARYDDSAGGPQELTIFAFGAGGTARLVRAPFRLEFLGEERITVPAGSFDTRHYKLSANADVWITDPDRIVVRHEFTTLDTRFELTELR